MDEDSERDGGGSGSGGPRRPTVKDLEQVLEAAKAVPAYMPEEAKLMTLLDDCEEWMVRSEQLALSGKTTRKRTKPKCEEVEHMVHNANKIQLQLEGLDLMEEALSEAKQWLLQVAGAVRATLSVHSHYRSCFPALSSQHSPPTSNVPAGHRLDATALA